VSSTRCIQIEDKIPFGVPKKASMRPRLSTIVAWVVGLGVYAIQEIQGLKMHYFLNCVIQSKIILVECIYKL
jgi:hypothetical protein